jgi:hypothetical protein
VIKDAYELVRLYAANIGAHAAHTLAAQEVARQEEPPAEHQGTPAPQEQYTGQAEHDWVVPGHRRRLSMEPHKRIHLVKSASRGATQRATAGGGQGLHPP